MRSASYESARNGRSRARSPRRAVSHASNTSWAWLGRATSTRSPARVTPGTSIPLLIHRHRGVGYELRLGGQLAVGRTMSLQRPSSEASRRGHCARDTCTRNRPLSRSTVIAHGRQHTAQCSVCPWEPAPMRDGGRTGCRATWVRRGGRVGCRGPARGASCASCWPGRTQNEMTYCRALRHLELPQTSRPSPPRASSTSTSMALRRSIRGPGRCGTPSQTGQNAYTTPRFTARPKSGSPFTTVTAGLSSRLKPSPLSNP
jgi:hypothetical protein